MTKRSLDDILADDDLISVPEETQPASSVDTRVRQEFEEILLFVDANGRRPQHPDALRGIASSTTERRLAIRLGKYLSKPEIIASLKPFDRHGVLAPAKPTMEPGTVSPKSVDEILSLDDGVLSSDHDDIFDLRFVGGKRAEPDWIANRTPCPDFDNFKPLFDACAAELANGSRKALRFVNEQDINSGDWFILNGVIVYVAEVNDPHVRYGRKDARLRCIYDNGTESELLLRSLARHLYKDESGRRISSPQAGPLFGNAVQEGDVRSGCIYIALYRGPNPAIRGLKNLHKIGVTTGKAERRIARASKDPTFLLAPAELLKTFTLFNSDPVRIERILHNFFGAVALKIDVTDRFSREVQPREWFLVPVSVIDEAVRLLMAGTLGDYQFDAVEQAIRRR